MAATGGRAVVVRPYGAPVVVSMALGEYVSVSSQCDAERDLVERERLELSEDPAGELEELAAIGRGKGLSRETAHAVAAELTAIDLFAAPVEGELGLDPSDLTDPLYTPRSLPSEAHARAGRCPGWSWAAPPP